MMKKGLFLFGFVGSLLASDVDVTFEEMSKDGSSAGIEIINCPERLKQLGTNQPCLRKTSFKDARFDLPVGFWRGGENLTVGSFIHLKTDQYKFLAQTVTYDVSYHVDPYVMTAVALGVCVVPLPFSSQIFMMGGGLSYYLYRNGYIGVDGSRRLEEMVGEGRKRLCLGEPLSHFMTDETLIRPSYKFDGKRVHVIYDEFFKNPFLSILSVHVRLELAIVRDLSARGWFG